MSWFRDPVLNTGLVSVLILSWDLSWFSDPVLNTGLINLDISSRVQKTKCMDFYTYFSTLQMRLGVSLELQHLEGHD